MAPNTVQAAEERRRQLESAQQASLTEKQRKAAEVRAKKASLPSPGQ